MAFDRLRVAQIAPLRRRLAILFENQHRAAQRVLRSGGTLAQILRAVEAEKAAWTRAMVAWYRDTLRILADVQARLLGGRVAPGAGKSARRRTGLKGVDPVVAVEAVFGGFPTTEGAAWEFDPWHPDIQRAILQWVGNKITGITQTTVDRVKRVIGPMIDAGDSIDKIAAALQGRFEDFGNRRAWMIARTEAGFALGMAQQAAAVASGVVETKTWSNSADDRVRDLHLPPPDGVDGETQPLDKPFSNGLMFPSDPNGPPEEVINCRCVCLYGVE